MTRIVADITISLDGYVTGPGAGPENGLGTGGEPLHRWAFSDDPVDQRILREGTARSGAVVMGRRLFDVVDGPGGWDDGVGYGAAEATTPPFVVVTSSVPAEVRLAHLDWTFVTTGLAAAAAVAVAQERAGERGDDRDVVVMGGGATIGSALAAGLLDELSLHVAPLVLGAGTPLFAGVPRLELVQRSVTPTSTAAHIIYDTRSQ